MGFKEESLQLMTSLGLSVLEAKVYLTLAKIGKASAKTISKAAGVAQPDVYRVLSRLQNQGLVEKEVAVPNHFKATTIDEGLALLFQRRDNQSAILHEKAAELLQNFKEKEKATSQEAPKFVMVPAVNVHRIRNAVDNAQKSVLCFTSLDMFRKVRFITEDVWKRCVEKGVKFQFIIGGKPRNQKVTLKLDPALKNNTCFEIKWTSTPMPCIILIDKKEVFLRTEMNLEAPVLWSNNAVIVSMIQEHFETKWKVLKEKYQEE